MSERPENSLSIARSWLDARHDVALATVTRTWGSAPRPVGSQMVVREDGTFAGSVSGGCVETAVIQEAQAALADGKVRNLEFGVSNEDAWAVGLACGGTIGVHVAPVANADQRTVLQRVDEARANNRAVVFANDLSGPEVRALDPNGEGASALEEAAREAARRDQSGTVTIDGRDWFLTVFNPPLDLAIIGAVHIAQPLSAMARLVDYTVRVIDPRERFASSERFPDITLVHRWADEAFADGPLGPRSAVVALTHDPKLDDPALIAALRSPAFYVGALGSRQTHAKRLARLKTEGFSDTELARIRGPVGLNIGARSPAEIAIAILAEITQVLRTGR